MARVVVVGAGVGGLAVAARLAALGHAVTVCEQAGEVGGKLGWYARDGFGFDTGPSLLTMPQVFEELFAATGAPLRDVLRLAPVEPVARYRYADGTTVKSSADLDRFCRRLDAVFGAGAGEDWRRLLDRARRIWAATRGPFLEAPGPPDLRALALRRPYDLPVVAPGRSLRGLGAHYLRDPRLRMLLDRYATYTGSDPRRAPAALAVVPYVEQAFGAWYVPGGLHRLGLAVAARAVERGARLRLRTEVRAVTTSGGRVDGVRLADGGGLPADIVVANADAERVYGSLVRAPDALARLRRATPSLSGFVLLLAVRGTTPGLAHHTVLFPADYDPELDAVFGGWLARDPTVYVVVPPDPSVAPAGCEAWFVLVNAARHGPRGAPGCLDWDRPGLAAGYAEHVLDLLAARGLPVRDRLCWYETIMPADLERQTGAVGGAI
ncbi:MAG TPA: phytoene desaturase family protein, partial [Frankiaceae bacterium]|nr:phytoene desaturase family protein [Frankiaceae bacterium]